MSVLITGGGGFLGVQLAQQLLTDPAGPDVVLVDRQPAPPGLLSDSSGRVRHVAGDLFEPATLAQALEGADAVVHLASVVSADAETDPERAWQVNVEGLRLVLRACAERAPGCRFVFTSSVAVFSGGPNDEPAGDATKHRPRTTYGMTKAIGELLIEEATRRGAIDGRVARLPTVIVRPGRPNLAASSFASGILREPLAGKRAIVPVSSGTGIVVIGHRAAVGGLARLLQLPTAEFGSGGRAVGLPGLTVTVADMLEALHRAGARHELSLGPVEVRPDPEIEAIVGSWPAEWDSRTAVRLGLPADRSIDDIIDAYLEDFGAHSVADND